MLEAKARNILLGVMIPFTPTKSDISICPEAMLDYGTQPSAMGGLLGAEVI